MAQTDVVSRPPTSPRPPETPPDSPAYMPDSPGVHVLPQVGSIDRFEHALEKLLRALEKTDTRNKTEDTQLKATKYVKAEELKIRASKLEYRLVDEV